MRVPLLGSLVALTVVGCSSSGSDGAGNASSAGAAGMTTAGTTGTTSATAGTANGGTANGGTANGGTAASAGGSANPNGGTPNGGNAAGGAADGGTGGSASGGDPGASGSAGTAGAAGSGGVSATVGTIVPLYTDPSDASWASIVMAKKAHPSVTVVAIVNPNSGPGAHADAGFTIGIGKLIAASIVPIGYVSTSYTARGEPAVKADIDSWFSFYPNLQGIFFDEQSNQAGDDTFYRDVSEYAKQKGLAFTVGNPGTSVPASYLGAVDVMLIYEEKGLPKLSTLAGDATQRTHYGIIPYGAAFDAAFVTSAKADVAYVYATSDDLPNPWDTLTPYFSQLLDALAP
jgi:Spherulation-specific family 4